MLIISGAAVTDAATNHPDPDFRLLLSRLLTAIACDGEFDPAELVRLAVIEPGDTMDSVETELGLVVTADWEARDQEGAWTALTYVTSDWGEGVILFLNQPAIDPAFLRLAASVTP